MIKTIFAFLLFTVPVFALAQGGLETDRPTETQSAMLVQKGSFQGEIGYHWEQKKGKDRVFKSPNAVFRYGLFNHLELRLQTDEETEHLPSKGENHSGLDPVELGLKTRAWQTTDTSFTVTLYGQIGVPKLASKDYQLDKSFYRLRVLFQNKLTDKIALNYNIGRDWDGDEQKQNWLYAVSPQMELSKHWSVFLETYGTIQKGGLPKEYFDAGVAYDIGQHVRIDIDAGKGLNGASSDFFFTSGISFNL